VGLQKNGVYVAFEMVDGTAGLPRVGAKVLAYVMPTSSEPTRPGPCVTPTASRSEKPRPA